MLALLALHNALFAIKMDNANKIAVEIAQIVQPHLILAPFAHLVLSLSRLAKTNHVNKIALLLGFSIIPPI